jgi:hypothetical protein
LHLHCSGVLLYPLSPILALTTSQRLVVLLLLLLLDAFPVVPLSLSISASARIAMKSLVSCSLHCACACIAACALGLSTAAALITPIPPNTSPSPPPPNIIPTRLRGYTPSPASMAFFSVFSSLSQRSVSIRFCFFSVLSTLLSP